MKYLIKQILVITFVLVSLTSSAQWYSYDKAESKEKEPNTIMGLISSVSGTVLPVKAAALTVTLPVPGSLDDQKKALQKYLTDNVSDLNDLRKALRNKTALSDSEKTVLYFLEKRRTESARQIFLPARTMKQAEVFYESSDSVDLADKEGLFSLEHAYLNYLSKSKKLAAYSEVMHDYIGPFRFSLGLLALAPSSKDSTVTTKKSDSIYNLKLFQDKFKSSGGMAQLNLSFPLLYLHDKNKRYFDLKIYASPRFCIDVPKEDTSFQRFAHHTQIGSEVQLKITTFEKAFTFLFCWRGFQGWGNSTFYDNMGFTGKDRKSFNFNTWTIGFITKKKLQFYYTWYSGDTRAVNQISKENNNSLTANYQF